MATIDSNIAMGYKPIQIENPLNQLAAMTQIQSGQQGQQMNMLKMQEYQRGLEEENKLRTLLSGGGDINSPDIVRQMYGISPTKGLEFQQKQATIKKAGLETTGLELKNFTDSMSQYRNALDMVRTPEQLLAWQEAIHKDPITGSRLSSMGIPYDSVKQQLLAELQKPGGFEAALTQSKLGATKFAELNKPNIQNVNRGSVSEQIQTPGMGGAPVVTRTAQVTATPGELLTNAREQQRINLGERRDIVANTVTDAAGNITQLNKFGDVIGKMANAGKPSATFEKTAALKKQLNTDLTTTIKELERVTVDKGLIDQSTGSGAGRLYDVGKGFFGGTTEGAIATAKLRPIADMVLKMVPRFEGPQSDKDTASYKEAAGQLADPTVPTKIRKEAATEIIRLMKNRKNQFVSDVMATEGMPAGAPALPAGFTADKP
jgi:hypothetical protein